VLEVTGDEIEPVRREILQRFGYRARFTHFPILGLCRACQERDAA
jgi:Fe2+ or Zn2+ uptake regulation protein